MFTPLWFRRVAERAVMTFAQALGMLVGGDQVKWLSLDWLTMVKLAGIAALLSVVTSVGKSKLTGDPENPGLE